MKNSFVEKLKAQTSEPGLEESKYFGFDPQANGRALMFELRTRDGRRSALPYSYLTRADFDPSRGIEVYVSSVVVFVRGRNLEDVYSYLLQNRLTWMREDSAGTDTGESNIFIEEIEVKDRGEVG